MTIRELKRIIDEIPEERLDEPCYVVEPHYRDDYLVTQARLDDDGLYMFALDDGEEP